MSNPAVIKLQSGKVGKSKVWLDDNFGESIHIHIDDYRVDLSVSEFRALYADLCLTLNELVDIEGLDFRNIDPVFLSVMLWPKLSGLKKVSYDSVRLGDMLAPGNARIDPLPQSLGVKAIRGLSNENVSFARASHHIGQNDDERMAGILQSIRENGYPFRDNYIVMYGDDNIIRDGQHRAACLYCLYGDVEVPVMRLHFDRYRSPKVDRFYNIGIRVFYRRHIKKKLYLAAVKTTAILKKIRNRLRRIAAGKTRGAKIDGSLADAFAAK